MESVVLFLRQSLNFTNKVLHSQREVKSKRKGVKMAEWVEPPRTFATQNILAHRTFLSVVPQRTKVSHDVPNREGTIDSKSCAHGTLSFATFSLGTF